MMKIHKVIVGYLEENCYILENDYDVLIIDPGDEICKIINMIPNKNVVGILITHRHFDHIGALEKLKETYTCPVYEYKNVKEQEYHVGSFTYKVLYTKGHSDDSVTYYFEKENCMFVGDFIFKGSIGRCDLEGGNFNYMKESLSMIKLYPNVSLYPGHGESTTLFHEIKYNPYFK